MAESLPEKSGSSLETKANTSPDLFSIECAVCLQTCVHPAELPCGHIFCFLCIKGIANQGRRCAMCRQSIPLDFLDKPRLLKPVDKESEVPGFDDGHQWFYEGQNGWWQYDERTSQELEAAYQKGERVCELLVAGYLYLIDFDSMLQMRRHDPGRRRRIKRDLATIPKKGIAGLKLGKNEANTVQLPDNRSKLLSSNLSRNNSRRRHEVRNEPLYDTVASSLTHEEDSRDLSSMIDQTLNWTIQQIESLQLDLSNQSEALTEDITHYEQLQDVLDYRRPSYQSRFNRSFENELDNLPSRSERRLNRSEENVSTNGSQVNDNEASVSHMRLRSLSSTEFPDQLLFNSRLRDLSSNTDRRTDGERPVGRSRRSLPRSLSLRNRLTSPLTISDAFNMTNEDINRSNERS